MILTIDIGNSNIVLGGVRDQEIVFEARLRTEVTKTSDQYWIELKAILGLFEITPEQIEGVIISSVVPPVSSAQKMLHTTSRRCQHDGPDHRTMLFSIQRCFLPVLWSRKPH